MRYLRPIPPKSLDLINFACTILLALFILSCRPKTSNGWSCEGQPPTTPPTDSILPPEGKNNFWFRYSPDNSTVIVFIHGILSDSRACWLYDNSKASNLSRYWPDLITQDKRFSDADIFMGGFYTAIDAGQYETRRAVDSELYPAISRSESGRRSVLNYDTIIFVTHSTGGIMARYLLDAHREQFANKKVGLVMLASPSAGSYLADTVESLSSFYGNDLARQLERENAFLVDLDSRFKRLLENKIIPSLTGVEACENHFVFHQRFLPDKLKVVDEESAGRYFGNARMLPGTNHFTIAKPNCLAHPSHILLADFYERMRKTPKANSTSNTKRPLNIALVLNGNVFYTREAMTGFTRTLDAALSDTSYSPVYEYVEGSPQASATEQNRIAFEDVLGRFTSTDYLVTIGTNVSEYAHAHYKGRIPLIFLAVTDPVRSNLAARFEADESRGNIAGVLYGVPTADYIKFVDRIFHKKRIGYVYNLEYSQDVAYLEQLKSSLEDAGKPFTIVPLLVNSPELSRGQLDSVDALVGRYFFMSNIRRFIETGKPTIAADISNVKKGAVASFATDAVEIGEIGAREIVMRHLRGEVELWQIPILQPSRSILGVNTTAARRLGVHIPDDLARNAIAVE